jgi:hypothetical protein
MNARGDIGGSSGTLSGDFTIHENSKRTVEVQSSAKWDSVDGVTTVSLKPYTAADARGKVYSLAVDVTAAEEIQVTLASVFDQDSTDLQATLSQSGNTTASDGHIYGTVLSADVTYDAVDAGSCESDWFWCSAVLGPLAWPAYFGYGTSYSYAGVSQVGIDFDADVPRVLVVPFNGEVISSSSPSPTHTTRS